MGVQRRDQGHQEPGLQARSEGKASQAASKDGWISVTNWCPTLCDPMDCSPQGSSVQGILQARTLEWAATSFSRGTSWPRDQTPVPYVSCTAGRFFTH